jgi:adenylyl-sulfate kinase
MNKDMLNCGIDRIDTAGDPVFRSAAAAAPPEGERRNRRASDVYWHAGSDSTERRMALFGHRPATIWLTGLSGAGKSTLAYEFEKLLLNDSRPCFVLDGDNIRHGLSRDLGFSIEDRKENIRRAAEVAHLMNGAGLIVIAAFISPAREDRAMASAIIGAQRFVEVHVSTAVEVCESRDPKGLYARARAGQVAGFTGVSAPYEPPLTPSLVLDTGTAPIEDSARILFEHIAAQLFRQ